MSGSPVNAVPCKARQFPWQRVAMFFSIFAVLLLSTNAFAWATFGHFFGLQHGVRWQMITAVVLLGFLPATIFGRDHSGLPLRIFTPSPRPGWACLIIAFSPRFSAGSWKDW